VQVLSPDVDTVALQRLRHTVDQMRDTIRSYEHQLISKSNEVDSVSHYCMYIVVIVVHLITLGPLYS